MRNDRGFALIAVLFMLVSLISVILACAYIPISEQREEARIFITYMNLHRYKRAIFGRLADQGGGEFTSCGGAISDLPMVAIGVPYEVSLCSKRIYLTGDGTAGWEYPFQYSASGDYWSGYRGKRFVYPLPSDDWDDNADYRYLDSDCSDDTSGAFLNGFGSRFFIGGTCGSDIFFHTKFLEKKECICFNGYNVTYVYVKDYTKRSPEAEIQLKLISCGVGQGDLTYEWAEIETTEDFILHRCKITSIVSGSLVDTSLAVLNTGFKKVLIQINEGALQNPEWVTRYTTGIVVPQWNSLRISPRMSLTLREDDIGIK